MLIDSRRQVELFTHQTVVKSILDAIVAQDTRLAAVHLVDSHHCRCLGRSSPPMNQHSIERRQLTIALSSLLCCAIVPVTPPSSFQLC